MATVVNRHHEPFDVYIGRGTPWGNPFTTKEFPLARCIELYRVYMERQLFEEPVLLEELLKLKGKRLGCSCKPKPCHGDVLVDLIKQYS